MKPDYSELGVSGLAQYSGYLSEEYLPELSGSRKVKIYRQMLEHDPIIGAMYYAIEMIARQVKCEIVAASDSNEDEQAAEFFRQAFFADTSQSWPELLAEILSFIPWGFAYFESCYKQRQGESANPTRRSKFADGKIGWRKFAVRSQDSLLNWEFDEDGGIQAMVQLAPPDFVTRTLPIGKCLLFRTKARKNSPEGVALLRSQYKPWYYSTNIERIEAIGIERDLAGLPVFEIDAQYLSINASADQKATVETLKKLAQSVRRDEKEGLVIPLSYDQNGNKLFDFKLLSTGGTRSFDTDKVIGRYNQQKLMTGLADFIMLGHEKVGSFALSSDKTNLFSVALGAFLDSIAGVFNRYEFPRLANYNAIPSAQIPRLQFAKVQEIPLAELIEGIVKLAGIGAISFPTENGMIEKSVLERMSLPYTETDEEPDDASEEDDTKETDDEEASAQY